MKTKGLGFMQLTIVMGFCLYYGYYLIAFFGAFAELPPGIDFIKAHLCSSSEASSARRACCSGSDAATAWRFATRSSSSS